MGRGRKQHEWEQRTEKAKEGTCDKIKLHTCIEMTEKITIMSN